MPAMQALLRLSLLLAAFAFSVASGSSQSNVPPPATGSAPAPTPPVAQPMDPSAALGLWKTNFGPVKIESDAGRERGLMGVWIYDRDNQEIIGYFSGAADGNVLNFSWDEPSAGAPLRGAGYLVFDPQGSSFTGRWWTDSRDRGGDWNGWRAEGAGPLPGDQGDPNGVEDSQGQEGEYPPTPNTYDPSRTY